jgi:hypothetical protein
MKVGWAYLALAAIFVIVGAYMGMIQGHPLGDLVLLVSLPLIYLGSTSLADANAAEDLVEKAHGTTEDPADDSDDA